MPNFRWSSVTAKANFHVSSPDHIDINLTNKVCPPLVGECTISAKHLDTNNPQMCVTAGTLLGEHCIAMDGGLH